MLILLDMSRHIDIRHDWSLSSHIQICLDTSKHYVYSCMHCLHSSRQCLDTIMIELENGLERKKIIYISNNESERYVSVHN